MNRLSVLTVVAVLVLTGCGSGGVVKSSSSTTVATMAAESATESANKIKTRVPSVEKVVTITENNDPNNKIGRPGGYTSAAVIYEKSVTCTELGADCGATIEVYRSQAQSKARAAYIQKVFGAVQMLGNEYDYVRGGALLRVGGAVKPSVAKKYNVAFGGDLVPATS